VILWAVFFIGLRCLIFDVFDFTLKWGDSNTVLNDLNSVVLNTEMAKKFFGDENPVGKILTQVKKEPEGFIVTGVTEPLPPNSSIQFGFFVHFNVI